MAKRGPLAFYVPSLTVGGAERVTVTVANGLVDRGYDVDLLVSYCEGAFRKEVNGAVRLVDLETRSVPAVGIGAAVPRLARYLRSESPAILFSQMTYANDICLLTHKLTGSDAVAVPTVHNTLGTQNAPKELFVQWLAGRLAGQADQFVAVSEGVAESIVEHIGVRRDNVTVLHNPIPVSDIREQARKSVDHRWLTDSEHEVMLGVGRLERQKDFETFLRAFKRVHESYPQTRAVIVGRGSKRDELERFAQQLGVGDVVAFPGYVDNPYGYMDGASVLAMSSVHEGLPTVLIEALACGCPVVSTDCPSGPREILQDGAIGTLVEVGDAYGLATAVRETIERPPPPNRLVDRANDFAPQAVLTDYERFVEAHLPDGANVKRRRRPA